MSMRPSELDALYGKGRTPALSELDGDLQGRALAPHVLDPIPEAVSVMRLFTRPELSPWRGKTFQSHSDAEGEGFNRFLVDGQWCDDPYCEMSVPNPFGGQNSVCRVT